MKKTILAYLLLISMLESNAQNAIDKYEIFYNKVDIAIQRYSAISAFNLLGMNTILAVLPFV